MWNGSFADAGFPFGAPPKSFSLLILFTENFAINNGKNNRNKSIGGGTMTVLEVYIKRFGCGRSESL